MTAARTSRSGAAKGSKVFNICWLTAALVVFVVAVVSAPERAKELALFFGGVVAIFLVSLAFGQVRASGKVFMSCWLVGLGLMIAVGEAPNAIENIMGGLLLATFFVALASWVVGVIGMVRRMFRSSRTASRDGW